ncbi:helix-turn-helix transcriptional regulator [Saccharomonospora xinjiangensis]|uniref:Helix-turn-helix protein n=1 Tax=Saccharomonospora xinjiangensis XJ-54 TaxID=882086 RepID=I0V5S6_9PSEU|nr:helix-turn-helix transcriptional regulator [Saccharomonospora xinjiangensis]EID55479.1 Helix-turn-helix protein [Saccharomonospora xinjiangensis XJ-54]QBQ61540.1 anaerobic benzoate catabolism transcriptional regulator [Saccharomonospora xinjiangensis]
MLIDTDTYQRILGEELRKLRTRRGWTRKELGERLQSGISLQTLATYELGTRQCSVVRLAELCLAMDELPQNLLARVHDRIFDHEAGQVRVNLADVVADEQPELLPLRRWARGRLAAGGSADVRFDRATLEQLASLCDLRTEDLLMRLRKLSAATL